MVSLAWCSIHILCKSTVEYPMERSRVHSPKRQSQIWNTLKDKTRTKRTINKLLYKTGMKWYFKYMYQDCKFITLWSLSDKKDSYIWLVYPLIYFGLFCHFYWLFRWCLDQLVLYWFKILRATDYVTEKQSHHISLGIHNK